MPEIPALPRIAVFANKGGGVTIETSDLETRSDSLVAIPIEHLPSVIRMLQEELAKINRGDYDDEDETDTETPK